MRMVTIAPGAVETELSSHTTDERIKAGYHDWKDQMGGVIAPEVTPTPCSTPGTSRPTSACGEIVLAGHPSATLMWMGGMTLPGPRGYHRPLFRQ